VGRQRPRRPPGRGKGRTIIKAPADLPAPGEQDPCAGAGLCWSAPDGPIKVRDLTTVGHANGILGLRMDGMLVARPSGRDHDEDGIAAFESHRLSFVHTTERGDGGEAGIYIGDTDDADAKVAHNTSTGWTFGFFFATPASARPGPTGWPGTASARSSSTPVQWHRHRHGNPCAIHQRPAGAWPLVGNRIVRNTRFCPAEGDSALPSSGVTVADGTKLVGSDAPGTSWWPGTGSATSWTSSRDESGRRIRFRDNRCRTSTPDGLCD
jgi:hypothetical protein